MNSGRAYRDCKVFGRYVDDVIRTAKRSNVDFILEYVSKLHPNLQFTAEEQANGQIPFLDMKIKQELKNVKTEWFTKPSDTGVLPKFRARCPG